MIKKITPQITLSILIVLLGFVHSNQTIDPVMIPRHTVAAFITAGFLFFLFIKKWGLKSLAFLKSKWALPFYLFIGSSILSMFSANTPSEAYFSIGQSIFVFALVIVFIDLIQSKKEHFFTLLKGFVILGLFFFLIGLYEYFQLNSDTEIYEVKSWLAHRNLFASIALFSGILSFAGYFFFKNLWKVISLANTFCSLFFVFSLGSRSAQLGLISVITLNLAIYFFNRAKLSISFKTIKQGVLIIGASVLLILTVVFVFHKIQPIDQAGVGKRFFAQDQKMYTIKERSLLWEKTAYMWLDAPITGVGAGNWKIEFPKYGSGIWRARQGLVQFQRPHNDFLWVLSETGILGFAGYLFIFLVAFISCFGSLKNAHLSKVDKQIIHVCLSLLVAYVTVAQFSFPKERMIHQLVLAFGLGTIFSYQSYKKAKPASNLVIPVLAIVVIFFGVLSTQRWKGEILSNKMMLVRESSNWNELIKYSVQADELWGYTLDPVSMPVLFYKGLAQLNLNQPDRSKASFQEALKIHPNNIHIINNLGGLYAMENDFENAAYYYEKALVIAPYYQTGVLNLVSNYFNANRVEEAYEILRKNEDRFDEQKEVYRNYLLVILRTMYLNSRDVLLSKNQIQLSVEPTDSTLLELEIIAYQGNKSVVEVFKEHMLNENSLANP